MGNGDIVMGELMVIGGIYFIKFLCYSGVAAVAAFAWHGARRHFWS